jgi:type IV pilus assembly protein PilB
MDVLPTPITRPQTAGPDDRVRLGDVLVRLGLLSDQDLVRALDEQLATGGSRRLGQVLRDLDLVDELDLAQGLAAGHQLPLVALDLVPIDQDVARAIPRSVAERSAVIPYARRGQRLVVAVADPVDILALDDVRALTGATGLDVGVATATQIRKALRDVWSQRDDSDVVRDFIHELDADEVEVEPDPSTDAATIRLVDRLTGHAARLHASDVHVEPQRDGVRIRFRVDGVLREIMSLPRSGYSAIAARLKIIAELDVIERRLPQDGRARVRSDGSVETRMSTRSPSMRTRARPSCGSRRSMTSSSAMIFSRAAMAL